VRTNYTAREMWKIAQRWGFEMESGKGGHARILHDGNLVTVLRQPGRPSTAGVPYDVIKALAAAVNQTPEAFLDGPVKQKQPAPPKPEGNSTMPAKKETRHHKPVKAPGTLAGLIELEMVHNGSHPRTAAGVYNAIIQYVTGDTPTERTVDKTLRNLRDDGLVEIAGGGRGMKHAVATFRWVGDPPGPDTPQPGPITFTARSVTRPGAATKAMARSAQAYVLLAGGLNTAEVATRLDMSISGVRTAARRHADTAGLAWPPHASSTVEEPEPEETEPIRLSLQPAVPAWVPPRPTPDRPLFEAVGRDYDDPEVLILRDVDGGLWQARRQ